MRYNIIGKGSFIKVKSIIVRPYFNVKIMCTGCRYVHLKDVSFNEEKRHKFIFKDGGNKKGMKDMNIVVRCENCEEEMGIDLKEKSKEFIYEIKENEFSSDEDEKVETKKVYACMPINGGFLISKVECIGCEILEIELFNNDQVSIIADTDRVVENISIIEECWIDQELPERRITEFKVVLEIL